jgi:hypothetical protein
MAVAFAPFLLKGKYQELFNKIKPIKITLLLGFNCGQCIFLLLYEYNIHNI